uniref:Tail fiber protein n=1 Tax=Myoviridae sp. ct2th6 TaxID=2826606 RepID=A0A8S5NPZ3_9CAUD|nr:MAG TPA: tail fiber protein [Myoviridae sp. ct2th6]
MINTSVNRALYKGDGTNTAFPISFPFLDKKDITVARVSKDNETTELKGDYFIDDTSRTVHFPGYSPGEDKPEAERPPVLQYGERLLIYRSIKINQESSLGNVWPFNVIEDALDKITMIIQDLNEKQKRSIQIPESADPDTYHAEFPYPKDGNVIVWRDGKLVNEDYQNAIGQYIEQAGKAATEAAQSADRAEASEINCKNVLTIFEDKRKEFQDFAMELEDNCETDLQDYTRKLLDSLDSYGVNIKDELLEQVESAKHYSEIAKEAAGFDPESYYTKEQTEQKIQDAISTILEFDERSF